MPRIVLGCLLAVGACAFSGNYDGTRLTCSDGICPAGLECRPDIGPEGECREKRMDAAIDMPADMMTIIDAPPAALTCGDAGPFPATGGMSSNTTMSRTSKVAAQCVAQVMNGPDAVYKIDPGAGKQMSISIATTMGSYQVTAYVISPCPTTACLQNMYATPGNPINVTAIAGVQYIVVDSQFSAMSGPYTLTVSVN
jgi:hypothetical protein